MVEALYAKAGLNLKDDFETLAKAPRIKADPGAVRRAEVMMTYTGRIQDPLVNVDNDDPVDPASDKLAYVQTLKEAGELLITDEYGKSIPFKQLYEGKGGQQLIVFIRHFFCGVRWAPVLTSSRLVHSQNNLHSPAKTMFAPSPKTCLLLCSIRQPRQPN